VVEQRGHVVGRGVEAHRRIAVGGAAVPLFFHGNDGAVLGENGQHFAESHIDGGTAAVQQHQRGAAPAVDFVVHADAVDGRVTALRGCHAGS